jgi:multimeric flavodoxin WrbA
VAAATIASDLVVLVGPIRFGTYSARMKTAIDHLIQLISPYFTLLDGEMHHKKRYKDYPALLAIGKQSVRDVDEEALFRRIIHHNAVNLYAPASSALVVSSQTDAELAEAAITAEIRNIDAMTR